LSAPNSLKRTIKAGLGRVGLLRSAERAARLAKLGTRAGRRMHAERLAAQRLYRYFIQHGDLCFDVGANIGSRTDVFLTLGARVVAIEPQDVCMVELRMRFGRNPCVTLVHMGLADAEGEREMLISNSSTTSSMAPEWVERMRQSGKLPARRWDERQTVPVTTLDTLLAKYGLPTFCKIDVEGFELEVLKGLSYPIPALSFEYTPGYTDRAVQCAEHLSAMGPYTFNYVVQETFELVLPEWTNLAGMCDALRAMPDASPSGDVYARLPSPLPRR
jgi:FkbM family methyltransferase